MSFVLCLLDDVVVAATEGDQRYSGLLGGGIFHFQNYARLRAFHYPGSCSDYVFTRILKYPWYLQGHLILTLVLVFAIVANREKWMRAEDQKLNVNLEWPKQRFLVVLTNILI